ncbi:MAG: DegT/DnrJ/EryC1/StrS family aminotransferase [Polyangiales bacterium]
MKHTSEVEPLPLSAAGDEAGIPLVDLAAQQAPLERELIAAFERVLRSQRFILGPEVDAFEAEIAALIGVPHALGVSSGTDALLLALMVLGIGPGDEVVVPAFSFFATAGCVARLGARPVFADIDLETYTLDVDDVRAKLTSATRAIIPVHLYGQTCNLAALRALATEHGLAMVEDAAQALGAGIEPFRAGSVGELGCFSFFPTKNLGALGDAGLVTTRDAHLAQRARLLRAHGAEPKYHHALVGGNFRLDAVQAACLRVKLPHLNAWTAARQTHAQLYARLFAEQCLPRDLLAVPVLQPGHVWHQYVIRTPRRDALQAHLREQQIGSEIYYPLPLHLQACFAHIGHMLGDLPRSERAAREVLALPVYPELKPRQIQRVVETVCDFLRRTARGGVAI